MWEIPKGFHSAQMTFLEPRHYASSYKRVTQQQKHRVLEASSGSVLSPNCLLKTTQKRPRKKKKKSMISILFFSAKLCYNSAYSHQRQEGIPPGKEDPSLQGWWGSPWQATENQTWCLIKDRGLHFARQIQQTIEKPGDCHCEGHGTETIA